MSDYGKKLYDLKKIFHLNSFIDDYDDFFRFANKFRDVQQRAPPRDKSQTEDLMVKLRCKVNLSEENYAKLQLPTEKHSRGLSVEYLQQFLITLLSYLDFKENERTAKLNKLRTSQENLPIFKYKNEILKSVKDNRITLIAGDTGCGKSTQVPQYLMDAGYSSIACTQPRRLACISLSKRVAYETQNKFGEKIGYQIRFERRRQKDTVILFLTEGLLLRQVSQDATLSEYDIIVLDEVHERHLHGDFLLGILKCLILQRDDLKVVLMSATINISLFQNYFGGTVNVIQVPGRLYPIKVQYLEPSSSVEKTKGGKLNPDPYVKILNLIDQKFPTSERGDVLIFVSGYNEITTILNAIHQYNEKVKKWIALPLHSTLSIADQDKVFDYPPVGMRKCVVSTNIAETSVTIDGIRFVIDSGMVKEMSYDTVCKMQRLKEFWVSKASAEQRKGRAGRTGPGVCYRLYTESDYDAMADYTSPEIKCVPLESLLLQMISMGLPDARKFPFIEAPIEENIESTIFALKQQGALTADEKITTVGALLSKLPVDIPIGKMLITGSMFHQIEPALSMAAALSVQSPMTNYAFRDIECEKMRSELESDHGDPISYLNFFREWLEVKNTRHRQHNVNSRRWCKERGLEEQRFYEMCKIRTQFKDLLSDCGVLEPNFEQDPVAGMTSHERMLRNGEVKLLKNLKRANCNDGLERKKKYLKPDTWNVNVDDVENDIQDIDFRLKNSHSQLQTLISGSTACGYTDLMILKLILANGLYPQVAIGDELNHFKTTGERLYHTQRKPYVFLHPSSYFGNHSDILQLNDSNTHPHPKFNSRAPLSTDHQVIFYMSLLETNKPYLVNTMRMPAAESILLFANELHSNSDFSRIICDSWIELRFIDGQVGEKLVIRMLKIREMWERLMQCRNNALSVGNLEQELSSLLISTMNFKVLYSLRRLLPADINVAYVGPGNNYHTGENPFFKDSPLTPHDYFGGTQICPFLIYDCLVDSPFIDSWECPHCETVAPLIALQKYQHLNNFHSKDSQNTVKEPNQSTSIAPNSVTYFCEICQETLRILPIEVLRHKKGHTIN